MDGTTDIATEAITTDIIMADIIISIGGGSPPFMAAQGIIVIGKQSCGMSLSCLQWPALIGQMTPGPY
jgi:hypothetical protein